MRYSHYAQDFAKMTTLLRAHQQSGEKTITIELATAASLACNYFNNLLEEREFLDWMENVKPEMPPDRKFANCINELIIPQTRELMEAAGYKDAEFIERITNEAQTLLNRKKAGLEAEGSVKTKLQHLKTEICLHSGSLPAHASSYSKGYSGGASAAQEAPNSSAQKIWNKLMKASIVAGAIAALAQIYDVSEEHLFNKDEDKKEQKLPPATPKKDTEKPYRVTAEFWIDVLRKLPPGANDNEYDGEW